MKFRCWDKNKKRFIKNVVIYSTGATEILRGNEELSRIINDYYSSKGDDMWGDYNVIDFTDWYGINDCEISISTEEKDNENKEIYENDYVEFLGKYYYVKFKRSCFLLENDTEEIWWHKLNPTDIKSSMLIIGNIYEQRKTKLNILKNLE